jgi:hypothetical protein
VSWRKWKQKLQEVRRRKQELNSPDGRTALLRAASKKAGFLVTKHAATLAAAAAAAAPVAPAPIEGKGKGAAKVQGHNRVTPADTDTAVMTRTRIEAEDEAEPQPGYSALELLVLGGHAHMIDVPLLEQIVDDKWNHFGWGMHVRTEFIHALLVAALTLLVLLPSIYPDPHGSGRDNFLDGGLGTYNTSHKAGRAKVALQAFIILKAVIGLSWEVRVICHTVQQSQSASLPIGSTPASGQGGMRIVSHAVFLWMMRAYNNIALGARMSLGFALTDGLLLAQFWLDTSAHDPTGHRRILILNIIQAYYAAMQMAGYHQVSGLHVHVVASVFNLYLSICFILTRLFPLSALGTQPPTRAGLHLAACWSSSNT